jgi:hypothetical protein
MEENLIPELPKYVETKPTKEELIARAIVEKARLLFMKQELK